MSAVVSAGDVVAGKYVVERVLGEGGMGVVVAAHHKDLGHRVAIKFLQPEALENPEVVARFEREARTLAKLRSEHVARVIDIGDVGGAQPFIVMEFLEGRDLSQLIDERGPLPIADAVGYILEAAHAIAEAHALGVVHRDLKPANLFLADQPDGRSSIKVLDFGIARHIQQGDTKLTRTGSTMGSPSYMAPEQMRAAETADERTDVWGFGAILFELLIGRVPFSATSVTEVVAKVLADPTPSLRAERTDIPASLENVVLQCLAKKPAERFASIAELAKALAPHGPSGSSELLRGITALARRGGQTAGDASGARVIAGADDATVLSREPGPTRIQAVKPDGAEAPAADASSTKASATPAPEVKEDARADERAPATRPSTPPRDVAHAHTSASPPEASARWPWIVAGAVTIGGAALWLGLRGAASTGAASASASTATAAASERTTPGPRHATVVAPQPSSTASTRASATPESSAMASSSAAPSASVEPSAAPATSGVAGPRTSSPPVKTSTPTAAPSSSASFNMGLK